MIQKLNPCPYCDGTGQTMVRQKHRLTNRIIPAINLCICTQSKFISTQYGMLDYLKNDYNPIEEVEKYLSFNPADLPNSPNYIIHGTLRCFHLHAKSMLIKYRFSDPKASLWFSNSIAIIHNFHVPQSDGESPHLSSMDTYDLVMVEFGVIEENKALKYGMAQIMANRKDRKPVWIYCPTLTLGGCSREYSSELEEITKSYKVVTLSCGDADSGSSISQAQNTAASFEGLIKSTTTDTRPVA